MSEQKLDVAEGRQGVEDGDGTETGTQDERTVKQHRWHNSANQISVISNCERQIYK